MRAILIAALLAFTATSPALADSVLDKAKAMTKDGPLYAFDVDYNDGKDQFRMSVDQSQPAGKRVTRITPEVATLKGESKKKASNLVARTQGDIWCSDFAENIPAGAKRMSETPASATYTFTPLPGKNDGDVANAYKYLTATAVIDKATGAILAYEMKAPKAFKPVAVAKIERFNMKVACKPLPDGRTYIHALDFDLKGSAMMQPLDQIETRRISNLKQLSKSGFGTP